jgi:mannose/fructose/N-acetylgalactosamine-specific phosphotransferase system component IIC
MSLDAMGAIAGLLVWGTVVGVDLVSFPQALLSRPLVTGAGAGLLLGDVALGLQVGLVLELFALDVLPVGAARYPDYGPGVVGAVLLASGRDVELTLGVATLFALGFAELGGWSLQRLRRVNGQTVRRYAANLATGDAATLAAVQYRGLAADGVRSLLLTALAIAAAALLQPRLPDGGRWVLVSAVAIGAGVAAAVGGAIRNAGHGARRRWLTIGAGVGLLLTVLR